MTFAGQRGHEHRLAPRSIRWDGRLKWFEQKIGQAEVCLSAKMKNDDLMLYILDR
jgi:hypothetical protein